MPKWEYEKADLNNIPRRQDDVSVLNEYGEDGWELVTIQPNNVAYLKRPLEETKEEAATPPDPAAPATPAADPSPPSAPAGPVVERRRRRSQ